MSTSFAFFATALMVLLYLAGGLSVVVIGACVLPSIIKRRPKTARQSAKLRHPSAHVARKDAA